MPLGKVGPHERGGETGTPLKKVLFCHYWLFQCENGCK